MVRSRSLGEGIEVFGLSGLWGEGVEVYGVGGELEVSWVFLLDSLHTLWASRSVTFFTEPTFTWRISTRRSRHQSPWKEKE